MSLTYTPGNIVVDEASRFGALHGGTATNWPDPTRWRDAIRRWLDRINTTRVGQVLLRNLQMRPASAAGIAVYIVAWPDRVDTAFTDGVIAASTGVNTTSTPAIFVTYSPADAFSAPLNLDPMRHPAPVLCHELTHALMKLHGLTSLTEADGRPRPIATWNVTAYPSHNEFLATTVQNMMLSEQGAVLADGYSNDDPTINSTPDVSAGSNQFGMRAVSGPGVDLTAYVHAYRPPLEFLAARMQTFTGQLAALGGIPFNPFAQLRAAASTGALRAPRGASGAAVRPGPVDISPR